MSRSTVSTAIGTLKHLGLIEVERHPDHDNVVYFFKRPIDNRLSFEIRFPDAKTKRLKHEASREQDKQKGMIDSHNLERNRRPQKLVYCSY